MKKHLTSKEIKKIFSDPLSLKKGIRLWSKAEGEKHTITRAYKKRKIKN